VGLPDYTQVDLPAHSSLDFPSPAWDEHA
jgi:hypothetical protein